MADELISRNDAIKFFQRYYGGVQNAVIAVRMLNELDTIDAVPVVRCKECRSAHKGGSGYIWCKGVPHPLDWFCADGKPKEGSE